MILCDTNVLIEFYKGNSIIISELQKIGLPDLAVSVVTTGELFYGARDKLELLKIQKHLALMKQIPFRSPDFRSFHYFAGRIRLESQIECA